MLSGLAGAGLHAATQLRPLQQVYPDEPCMAISSELLHHQRATLQSGWCCKTQVVTSLHRAAGRYGLGSQT